MQPTCVNHFAPDSQIDMALLGGLLHKLNYKLVRFPDNRGPIHADQFVPRSQAAISICSTQWHNVTNVNLREACAGAREESLSELRKK